MNYPFGDPVLEGVEESVMYGVLRSNWNDVTGVTVDRLGAAGTPKQCEYCGLNPGGGAHKCLNCGAPK